MTWVRVYKDYLLFALQRRKFAGLVEVMVWLYALANLRNSGVCQINQSKLAKMLGHAGSKTVNRAILSLVAKGVLTAVGSESQGERLYALERGAARVGRIKRG